MRAELTSPARERLHRCRSVPVDVAIALGEKMVNPRTGPVVGVSEVDPDPEDSGRIYQFVSQIQQTNRFCPHGLADPDTTGGTATDRATAKIAAIGEAIERYCLSLSDPTDFRTASYERLDTPALNPLEMNLFSERQRREYSLSKERTRSAEYDWTMTTQLTDGTQTLIPGQLVYLPFQQSPMVREPTTTGAAAGMDYESAIYRALCEVVERECFIIGYLNRLPFPKVDLSTAGEAAQSFATELKASGQEVHVFDISLDHPFESCLAVAVDEERLPAVSLGLNCSVSMNEAVRGALREALQISSWDVGYDEPAVPPEEISTLPERARYWGDHHRIDELSFWLETEKQVPVRDTELDRDDALTSFESFLRENGYEAYVADVTTADVEECGFKVVKVVVPQFHPMHLVERYRYLGSERLYEVPVACGFLESPREESSLTSVPHPFL